MEATRDRRQPVARQWSIPTRLTLAVVPIVVVALLLAVFLAWSLATRARPRWR
jgi:CHASE3 domain sensor protein